MATKQVCVQGHSPVWARALIQAVCEAAGTQKMSCCHLKEQNTAGVLLCSWPGSLTPLGLI